MPAAQSQIVIDGSHGEGGGALLRTAFTVSALTQQSVRITSVRGGTNYPGLDPEDLTILAALGRICSAQITGATPGSDSVTFEPTTPPRGLSGRIDSYRNDSHRGSNACVVLGTLLPALARSGVYSILSMDGETFGSKTLSFDYFAHVTLPTLRRAGLYAMPELLEAGFGRESRGNLSLEVEPSALNGITWTDRGRLLGVRAVVSTGGIPSSVGGRAISHLRRLAQNAGLQIDAEHAEVETRNPGFFVTVWATYDRGAGGGTMMGTRGMRAEMLTQGAFEELFQWMSGPSTLDPFLADQILIPLVFADGESTFTVSKLTQRFLTCAWVVKQFAPIHITIRGTENAPATVTIRR